MTKQQVEVRVLIVHFKSKSKRSHTSLPGRLGGRKSIDSETWTLPTSFFLSPSTNRCSSPPSPYLRLIGKEHPVCS